MADASRIGSQSSMDTSSIDSPPLSDVIPSGFVPVIVPARSEAELLPDSSAHLLGPLYPNKADHKPTPLHVPIREISPPAVMDLLNSAPLQPRQAAPGFIPDFPPSCEVYSELLTLEGSMAMESHLTLSASTSPQPQIQSPSVLEDGSSTPVGMSSLASALDNRLSRINGDFATSSTTLPLSFVPTPTVSSASSLDPTGIAFPQSEYDIPMSGIIEKAPHDPHKLALRNMFESIGMTAQSARNTCLEDTYAQTGAKIDELLCAVSLIAKMFKPLSLSNETPQHYPAHPSNPSFSPPLLKQLSPEHSPPYDTPPASSDLSVMELRDNLDSTDLSRKRCASATPEDRVIKALKREPKDDSPLAMYPPTIVPATATLSAPPSRPPSPKNLPASYGVLPLPLSVPTSTLTLSQALDSSPPELVSVSITPAATPSFRRNRSSWSDQSLYTARQHQHTLSGGTINPALAASSLNGAVGIPPSLPTTSSNATYANTTPFPSESAPPLPARAIVNGSASQPLGRVSRSGSITIPNPFAFAPVDPFTSMESHDFASRPSTSKHSPGSDDDEEDYGQEDQVKNGSMLSENGGNSHSNEVPLEYREEVDRVFFEFLNRICSNLDATDSKGEAIHQTLMAKKMQRLDESPDFRPFKFRIAAFTNAFLEELANQGYPEEKIPMKKIRNYLWKQPHIQRFNEEGKKSKSKGNHIWNIDAKRTSDGRWEFRPFHRRLAGYPTGVAYVGLRWSWTPRIWDPQASSASLPVQYSSPILPSWLSWKDNALSGIPPPDAESCEITAEAKFTVDGVENRLKHTFILHIAPMSSIDPSYSASRRPSVSGEMRRVASDPVVPQAPTIRPTLPLPSSSPMSQQPTNQISQVTQVLASAAQRVAQSQVIASMTPNEVAAPQVQEIANQQSLAKQQHVLNAAATAGQRVEGTSQPAESDLAFAAQQVVLQAAFTIRDIRADRSAAAGTPTLQASVPTLVTVGEVSVATQSAVAKAVEMTDPMSSEVDVLMTATSILQGQSHALDSTRMIPVAEPVRPHSTGALLSKPYAEPLPGPTLTSSFPPPHPLGLTEYGQP